MCSPIQWNQKQDCLQQGQGLWMWSAGLSLKYCQELDVLGQQIGLASGYCPVPLQTICNLISEGGIKPIARCGLRAHQRGH